MKVREAVKQLLVLDQELDILDEYAENELGSFYVSSYDDKEKTKEYVVADFVEVVG